MRFDLHMRGVVREQIEQLAATMKVWEEQPRITEDEKGQIRERIQPFVHTTTCADLRIAGTDGSGEFPALSYADSFVYVAVAQGTLYERDAVTGLREVDPASDPLVHFTWLPEDETARRAALDAAFAFLAGVPIAEVVQRSDYRRLKAEDARRAHTTEVLLEHLIRPHAADAGNLGIQLRSTAELGAALRLIEGKVAPTYVLMDGTLSLPLVSKEDVSLFYEHLKRLCCVEARSRGIAFCALSKSHGLPSTGLMEELAREKKELEAGRVAEHWYLRLPVPGIDWWQFAPAEGRRLPPAGAVTYLVRFHRTTHILRLDMDRAFWEERIKGPTESETRSHERRLFEDLDYASHDQRCFGRRHKYCEIRAVGCDCCRERS